MFKLDNLLGQAKDALKGLSPDKLKESKNVLENLSASAFSELTKNVDLLKGIDTNKPIDTNDNTLKNIVSKIETVAMSKLVDSGKESMLQGLLKQVPGAFSKNASSLFELLPNLISGFNTLKSTFSSKADSGSAKGLINDLLSKAKPALDLLKLMN